MKQNVTTILKHIFYFCLFTFAVLLLASCTPTEPPVEKIKPGRRDYAWTVDTLFIPFTYLERIWGSSPTDVWAIGQGGDKDKIIYHYDGKKWSTDGKSRGIAPFALWGFGQNDVWIGGYGPLFHYNGTDWQKDFEYINPDLIRYGIQDIWGDSPNNVWAVGFADSSNVRIGIIFHYNGIKWKRVNIGFTRITMMRIKRGKKTSNNYFIWGLRENNTGIDTTKLLEFDGEKLKELHSSIFDRYHWNYVQEVNDEVIFMIGNSLYLYNNGNFKNIIENNSNNTMDHISGRNIKDIFWSMRDGIIQFNGSSLEYILKYNDKEIRLSESFVFKKEVFFLTNNFSKSLNIIYHGVLK